ncbi:4-aminobutyrate aminotransferase / (S)-3-amino-2-methylpropionate transaminase [Thermoflavimicrobium dichotomicum]|uniref:(S)-3-amino-2-methylpropionate transaminase n=1 Tax=Thermoflavimicrobium dichotomicum TaxID=46223 RepID=A0A1I3USK2_9BACL|nr:4-aminobutyrate aminotransferase / (S)-3-amino-2-methylpropionate transaminase [Thermoflavimicrobium dichotomicum]
MTRSFIRLKTEIPGPKSKEWLAKRNQHVPRGTFNATPVFIERGEGALVTDVDGNTLIDFAGAIGSLNVGHCPQKVVEALQEQITKYLHPCFHVMMYEPYIQLAEKLNEITPGSYEKKTFFLNSGAEAVENAVKIARKYTGRKAILSFERGFHGRTLLAMSLTSKVKPYKFGFGPFAPDTYKLPYPYYYHAPEGWTPDDVDDMILQQIEEFFLKEVPAEDVAAIIIEPVQGEGGFVVPSKKFVQGIRQICDQYGILMIADEIQTGFGRTGKMFAIEHFQVVPDLITMSKSIAAGIPISAVTGRSMIMDAPEPGQIGGTYGGSPLGCVAALAVIEMIEQEQLLERACVIGEKIRTRFGEIREKYEIIGDVRGLGAMCAFEITSIPHRNQSGKELVGQILSKCYRRGVVMMSAGLYGNVIRVLAPLVITDEQLQEGLDVIDEAIAQVVKEG